MNEFVKFKVFRWKTKEYVGDIIVDYGVKCYYECVPIYLGKTPYPFICINDLINRRLADVLYTRYPNGTKVDVHKINFWIENRKWTTEGKDALHHKNRNKMDARVSNLQIVPWNYIDNDWHKDGSAISEEARRWRENIDREIRRKT